MARTSDEVLRDALEWLRTNDPDVLAAVDDVDRSLIAVSLARPPLERLRDAWEAAEELERWAACLRRVSTS